MKYVWGNGNINWLHLSAEGNSGGLLVVWDGDRIEVEDSWEGLFSVSIL